MKKLVRDAQTPVHPLVLHGQTKSSCNELASAMAHILIISFSRSDYPQVKPATNPVLSEDCVRDTGITQDVVGKRTHVMKFAA